MASMKPTTKKNTSGTPVKKENPPPKGNKTRNSTATKKRSQEENAKSRGISPEDSGGTYLVELYESQINRSQEEIDNLKKNEENLIKERNLLVDQNQRLREENTKLKVKSSSDGVPAENRRLQDEDSELNRISSTDGTEKEKDDLRKKIDHQSKELDALGADKKRLQEEIAKLKETSSSDGTEKEKDDLRNKIDHQSKELDALGAEKKKLQEEIAKLKETSSSDGKLTEVNALKQQLEEEKKSLGAEKKRLQEEIAKLKETSSSEGKLSEVNALKQQLEDEKKSKEECVKEIRNDSELEKQRKEAEIRKLEKENKEVKQRIEQLQRENKELIEDIDKRKELRKKPSGSPASSDIFTLRQENETLRNRLSELAGAKLTEGNPNIADLSDKNRPTNLAENFSEIYDNEWTDALEELTDLGKKSEAEGIKVLLDIIKNAYEFSSKQATSYYSCMSKGLNDIGLKDEKDWPLGVSKQVKDHRKSVSVLVAKSLSKAFITTKHQGYGEATKKYAEACASLCWFMCVQDPPVYIDASIPTGTFNKDKYRAYTKSGQAYEFLVWPALYLHKDGQLLGKGIAQGS